MVDQYGRILCYMCGSVMRTASVSHANDSGELRVVFLCEECQAMQAFPIPRTSEFQPVM